VQADGTTSGEMDLQTLNLKANFLWHSDSTFLPVPALVNILTARIVTTEGGATELASTRAAWAEMPEALKAGSRGAASGTATAIRARRSPRNCRAADVQQMARPALERGLDQPGERARGAVSRQPRLPVDGYDEAESEALSTS
jgi:alpha-ketoglutarate-dependent 2,4-dichlorophenoxyacetate dioxygenase